MGVIIFYHNDLDGRCAAAIVRKRFPDGRCFEVNYNDPLPIDQIKPDDKIFIVDFTPPKDEDFDNILNVTHDLIWIDHHGRNIKEHKFYDKCIEGLRVEKTPSGAGCTWNYLFPGDPTPDAVTFTSDYDTWTHAYGKMTEAFEAGMQAVDHSPTAKIWDNLLANDPEVSTQSARDVIATGNTCLSFRKNFFKDVISKCAFKCDFEGHTIIACNMPNVGSKLFQSLDLTDIPMVSTFYSTGKDILISLYSEGEQVDCGEIAQKHGGGGHKGAAGFTTNILPFENIREIEE